MNKVKADKIKEIAGELDCGFRVFMHKTTQELVCIPNEADMLHMDTDDWQESTDIIENHFDDYLEIQKWSTHEAFEIMADFAAQLSNGPVQKRLLEALNQKKPFSRFKYVVDNAGEVREQWFAFKDQQQQDFVARQLSESDFTHRQS